MFGEFETRDTDYHVVKPFCTERRHASRRRRTEDDWGTRDRRKTVERRLDADWRFALIRRAMRFV